MERVRLGKTELQVSPIAFGTWSFGGDWGRFDTDEANATIGRALELGITLFDTAQAYGRRPAHLDESAAAADIVLASEELAGIDAAIADAIPVWGPHPEVMPPQSGGAE